MTDARKAEAVWKFIVDHNFHYRSSEEGWPVIDKRGDFNNVRDALKILNVYGYSYCFTNVAMTTKLWDAAGFDSTRVWGLNGHVISEVYYDKTWHYYDGDQSVSAYFLENDGKTVASSAEIQDDPERFIINSKYHSNPSMPYDAHPVYEHESRAVLSKIFKKEDDHYIRDNIGYAVHKMDYYLRKNESFTLFFDKQGRWRQNGMDITFIDPAKGPYDAHSARTYTNGLFEYQPDFRDPSVLSEGFYSSKNAKCDGKLAPLDPEQPLEAVIKVSSPYIITGTPLSPSFDSDLQDKYYGAAVVHGHLSARNPGFAVPLDFEIQISSNQMLGQYKTVFKQASAGYFTVDLSEWMWPSAYYYTLKFILKKSRAKDAAIPSLDSLRIDTWVQASMSSLPRLVPGENKITYSANGPVVDKVDVERYYPTDKAMDFVYASKNIQLGKENHRRYVCRDTAKPGELIFEIKSEEGPIVDYAVVFLTHMREKMRSTIYYSENDTLHWAKMDKKEKLYAEHWADWYGKTLTAGPNVTKVYFKAVLEGQAALTLFNYSYRYAYKAPSGEISVVQAAEVDGKFKEFAWDMKGREGTQILKIPGKKVVNKYLKFICR
jgi:hypothetical protein